MHRRAFIATAAGAAGLLATRLSLARTETDRRLVIIVLRGAMDGVHAVAPYGDPAHAAIRRHLATAVEGAPARLDGLFALHPALTGLARLYAAGEALFVHAVATPYRERSHFDGQGVLETGGARPHGRRDGWLNRLLPLLPEGRAVALAATVPLLLQGPHVVSTFAPAGRSDQTGDLLSRVGRLYEDDDLLHPMWADAMATREMAGGIETSGHGLVRLAAVAAGLLRQPEGPRVAVLESGGWDTHANQVERLARKLTQLDEAMLALQGGLGPAWRTTVAVALTEFGRAVAPNGTNGTDHGTASAMIVAGGAVRGGRVVADWPGLRLTQLREGRDLRPTLDVRAVLLSTVAGHFLLDADRVAAAVFPDLPGDALPVSLVRA